MILGLTTSPFFTNTAKATGTYDIPMVTQPSLPWHYVEAVGDPLPYIYLHALGIDGGGPHTFDPAGYQLVTGTTNTTKFYRDGNTLKATTSTYVGSYTEGIGWDIDCDGTLAGVNACYYASTTTILDYSWASTALADKTFETAYHKQPIYTDSTATIVLYPPNLGQTTYFQAPKDGNVSHDFNTWWVCFEIPQGSGIMGYNVKISYGLASGSFDYDDNTKDAIGYIPVGQNETVKDCPLITKETDLTPEVYKAKIEIFDQSDQLLSTSATINFTITSGAKVDFANDGQIVRDRSQECDTKWSNFFARYGCKIGVFLFVPDQTQLQNQLDDLNDRLANNIPFSYFYAQKITINGTNITTTNSQLFDVNLPIQTGTLNTTLAFNGFSSDDTRIQGVLSPFRTWMNIFLYLTLGSYFIFRALRFFRPL